MCPLKIVYIQPENSVHHTNAGWSSTVGPHSTAKRSKRRMLLLAARRSALAAATTRRYAVWSRPVVVTTRRWLTGPPSPPENPPSAAVTSSRQASPAQESAMVVTGDAREVRWSRAILPALEVFAQVHGHCLVPQRFIVPATSAWPTDAWGVKLGLCVSSLRSRAAFSRQARRDAARLAAIDFAWNVDEYKWTEQILPALTTFAAKFGHCDVPQSFVVPSDPAWPRKAWKLNIGRCINTIRFYDAFNKQTQRDAAQLEAIGFMWCSHEHRWGNVILPALEAYFTTHGHCDIPIAFVVPSTSPWPQVAWGLRLGMCASNIRSNGNFATQIERDAPRLDAIDFVWRRDEYQWTRRILPSLEVFHRLEGHSDVPIKFVVPSESPWPESSWGSKLGQVLSSIRLQGTYARLVERDAERLMELGFTVKPKRQLSAHKEIE
jgi:hypothetical protein